MASQSSVAAHVVVGTREFVEALAMFKKFLNRKAPGNALLTFDGTVLRIDMLGMARSVSATGMWDAEARVNAGGLIRLAEIPASDEPINIHVSDGECVIAFGSHRSIMPCVWGPHSGTCDGIAVNSGPADVVALAESIDRTELDRLGLGPGVEAAKKKLGTDQDTLERRIATAARALRAYGVTESDLRTLVENRLRSATPAVTPASPPTRSGTTHLDSTDPRAAARVVEDLRERFHMTDEQFQELHYRRTLKPGDGVSAHLRYLSTVTSLREDQQQLARRMYACRAFLAAGERWPTAMQKAQAAYPRTAD